MRVHLVVTWWLVGILLLASSAWGEEAGAAGSTPIRASAVVALLSPHSALRSATVRSPPMPGDDSIRAKLKACLLVGNLECVVNQWMLLKGTEEAPEWLTLFQRAFDAGNRQAGRCMQVARAIHEGLTRLGQRPEFYRVTLVGEQRKILGFDELANGVLVRSHQVATNGLHVAVRLQGRIIDAYTGLAGLPEEEYVRRLVPYPGMKLVVEVVESL